MSEAIDLDGDEVKDILSISFYEIVWFKGLGEGQFSKPQKLVEFDKIVLDAQIIDLDKDGHVDVLYKTDSNDNFKLFYLKGLTEGIGFENPIHIVSNISKFQVGDINTDGKLDVLYLQSKH